MFGKRFMGNNIGGYINFLIIALNLVKEKISIKNFSFLIPLLRRRK